MTEDELRDALKTARDTLAEVQAAFLHDWIDRLTGERLQPRIIAALIKVDTALTPEQPTQIQESVEPATVFKDMPNPTEEDLADPIFEAIWQMTKTWDVNAPEHYSGYCGMNGSHVKLILDAVRAHTTTALFVQERDNYYAILKLLGMFDEAGDPVAEVARLVEEVGSE